MITKLQIEVTGLKELRAIMRILGEKDTPVLKEAMNKSADRLTADIKRRSPRHYLAVATRRYAVKRLRYRVAVNHPRANSFEWGRRNYYRRYKDDRIRETGKIFRSFPGFKRKAYIGPALVSEEKKLAKELPLAVVEEWEGMGRRTSL